MVDVLPFCTLFLSAFLHTKHFLKKGSTIKGKNLVPFRANLPVTVDPFLPGRQKAIWTELPPLKVYLFLVSSVAILHYSFITNCQAETRANFMATICQLFYFL